MRRLIRGLHPTQLLAGAFALVIYAGSALLYLPVATVEPGSGSYLTALFMATSAVCVTGLAVVDVPEYYTQFGEVVLLGLAQIGGFGIMTLTSLLALVVARRLGLRSRMIAQTERSGLELGDVRRVVVGVAILSLTFEAAAAAVLTARFFVSYDYGLGKAIYHGVFHAVSAFNNAGIALYSDSLTRFVTDGWITLAVAIAVIAGGLGFPVWFELRRLPFSPRKWSIHTKLTLSMTLGLLLFGMLAILGFEWSNDRTLGSFSLLGKLDASFFQGVVSRTAGFSTVDFAGMQQETLLVTDMLMFVGAGSASTGGGIKVTTFAVLALMVYAEVRGDTTVNIFRRRIPPIAQRQALTVVFIALNAVVIATLVLMAVSPYPLYQSLFESISAFATVGLSTGITADLPDSGKIVLIVLMYLGRVGPQVLGAALVLRERERLYQYPEERPFIG
jgi:trk system potassium uptake protein TrkH